MDTQSWIALTFAFILGAISPGPSLAAVLRNTFIGGKRNGILTAIGHGLGFSFYSFVVLLTFASIFNFFPVAEIYLRYLGILLLISLAYIFAKNAIVHKQNLNSNQVESNESTKTVGFLQGFFVAILNPKILAWMIAIYTPFINDDVNFFLIVCIALLGLIIDGGWYILVAIFVGNNSDKITTKISSRSIDLVMSILMIFFAGLLSVEII